MGTARVQLGAELQGTYRSEVSLLREEEGGGRRRREEEGGGERRRREQGAEHEMHW